MMTVQEFIGYFKMAKDKEAECKKRIKNIYIPFAQKMAKCQALATSTMEFKSNPESVPVFMQNTISRYLLFSIHLISTYTDLEIPDDDFVNSYDKLKEAGAFEILMQNLPEVEVKEYSTLLKMAVDDYLINNRDLTSYIDKKFEEAARLSLMAEGQKQNENDV